MPTTLPAVCGRKAALFDSRYDSAREQGYCAMHGLGGGTRLDTANHGI
jgi:hypothetical protein